MTDHNIGVDNSKSHLDAFRLDDGAAQRFDNSALGFRALTKWLGKAPVARIVFELNTALSCMFTCMSIRIDQAGYSFHFRRSRSNAFAMTMSLRMTAVMASFLHFPVDTNCSYFAFMSGLKRVATTAGK